MDIKELKSHFDEAATNMKALIERQSDEIKAYGASTSETAAQIKSVGNTLQGIQDEIKSYAERLDAVEKRANHPGFGDAPVAKSLGQMVIDSDEFKHTQARRLKSMSPVQIDSGFFKKDISSAASSAGALVQAMRLPDIYTDPGDRPQHMRDIMVVGSTESNAIEFMCEDDFENEAAPQYDSESEASELVAKEKSNLTFELKTVAVRTLAHYMVASRQILDDASMLRSFVDGRLRYGLALEEDRQILYGTNTGADLDGIMTNAGVQNAGGVPAGQTGLDHIRRAIALARLAEYPVTGIVLNPSDWADLELTKDNEDRYIWVTVPNGGDTRLWRVPVIETTAINTGDFLLGNFNLAVQLWDRQQSVIRVSESHEDLFIKNGVVILGEERVAQTIYRPKALVKGSFLPAST